MSERAASDHQVADQGAPDQAVSPLELLFDLVFVFTVTQITGLIDHHPGLEGWLQGVAVCFVLYWMYGGFAWLTNSMGTSRPAARVTVLLSMALLLVCSLAVPTVFHGSAWVFGSAYLALTLTHFVGYLTLADPRSRRGCSRFLGPANAMGALVVLGSAFTHGWLQAGVVGAARALLRVGHGRRLAGAVRRPAARSLRGTARAHDHHRAR